MTDQNLRFCKVQHGSEAFRVETLVSTASSPYTVWYEVHSMITTNPPEGEPEPEPVPNLVPKPETTSRTDRYIDDKFLEIFNHEDRNGALSRIFTEGLSQNDDGSTWAPITSWRDWWQRAKRAEDHR